MSSRTCFRSDLLVESIINPQSRPKEEHFKTYRSPGRTHQSSRWGFHTRDMAWICARLPSGWPRCAARSVSYARRIRRKSRLCGRARRGWCTPGSRRLHSRRRGHRSRCYEPARNRSRRACIRDTRGSCGIGHVQPVTPIYPTISVFRIFRRK